jgi:hypothetical protein
MDFKPYVDLFSSLLTPTIGITTGWIAIQQFRLAKERMKRDLYDRRIIVYRGVIEVLSSIMSLGQVRGEDLANWARATAERGFLFDAALCEYLESIRKQIVTVWAFGAQLKERGGLPVGEQRSKVAGQEGEALLWLANQLPEVQGRFAKYLRVT